MHLDSLLHRVELCDRLHDVERSIYHRSRKESDSEHTYAAMQLFFALESEIPASLNHNKIYQLLLVHDMAEVLTGDTKILEVTQQTLEREESAAGVLLSPYPDLQDCWNEFARRETRESLIANKIDKLQAICKIINNNGREWKEQKMTYDQAANTVFWILEGNDYLSLLVQDCFALAKREKMFFEEE